MLDDLGGRQRAEPAAGGHVAAPREAGEESGGEHVARAGRVDEPRDREGGRLPCALAFDHDAALLGAGDDSEHALGAQRVERLVEMRRLVERQQFVGIGEQRIDRL